jgi:MFS family permease
MAVLALPAGVLADSTHWRRLILVVQSVVLAAQATIVVLTFAQSLRPLTLLALIAVLAAGGVLTFTSFQSMVPDLVDRGAIPSATALIAMATNSARILAPALAGLLIAVVGLGPSFAAVLPLTLILLLSNLRRRDRGVPTAPREAILAAVFSGARFVRHSPQALGLAARGLWFTIGIVLGGVTLPAMRRAVTNTVVAVAFGAAGLAVLTCALANQLLVVDDRAGDDVASIQLYLPTWVRARGIATLLVAFYGGQAIGSAALGWAATYVGVHGSLFVAAFVLLTGASIAVWWPLHPDPTDGTSPSLWQSGGGAASQKGTT